MTHLTKKQRTIRRIEEGCALMMLSPPAHLELMTQRELDHQYDLTAQWYKEIQRKASSKPRPRTWKQRAAKAKAIAQNSGRCIRVA